MKLVTVVVPVAAAMPGVVLFHRFDLMRDWAESGALDLERADPAGRPAMSVRLHACLGGAMAHMLMDDLAEAAD